MRSFHDCGIGAAPHSLRAVPDAAMQAGARARDWPTRRRSTSTSPSRSGGGAGCLALARRAAGRVAARPRRRRSALVPDARHAHDRAESRAASPRPALSPASARRPKPTSATASSRAPPTSRAGGAFGIGGDSNVRMSLAEELRGLEYSQRLTHRARNVLAAPGASVGARCSTGGPGRRRAARWRATPARSTPGALADLVAIDRDHPVLTALDSGQLLDGWIFAADDRVVRDVWSAGAARRARAGGTSRATRSRRAIAPRWPG